MQVVIPSRRRIRECRHAVRLFPDALVVVREDEYDTYRQYLPDDIRILSHPDSVSGIGPLKNWIFDNVDDEALFLLDDDVKFLKVVAGFRTKSKAIVDPVALQQVLENAEHIARGIGAPVFGFDQTSGDVRKFRPQDPISFNSWVGAAMGIIGRDLRYDERLKIRADIDFCLQALLSHRIVYTDRRFSFIHHERFSHPGGNTHLRSDERSKADMRILKQKWGDWVEFRQAKTTTRIIVKVKRRQSVKQSQQHYLFV